MNINALSVLICEQKQFFSLSHTKNITFRIAALKKLKNKLVTHEQVIMQALYADLKKPPFEAYTTELWCVLQEINYAIAHINSWCEPHNFTRIWLTPPARSYQQAEPLGTVLIIAPWNYPLQLTLLPLVGAIAAGNCAIIKPSEYAPRTAALLATLLADIFDPAYITVMQGGSALAQELLAHQFDYIFFTGSTAVGKLVMQQAAQHLTPLTLELGGKSPCIVDASASIACAAQRIAWGKFLNAGQSCVAPDYVLVHHEIKNIFIKKISDSIAAFFGNNPQTSPDYGRIINHAHFDRLANLLTDQSPLIGGNTDRTDLYIAPTVILIENENNALMHEEIFGPILPILTYKTVDDALKIIAGKPKPIAIYLFSTNTTIHNLIMNNSSSGSVCINETIVQASSSTVPFGGVGMSGFGSYHGKKSFDTFSRYKTVVKSSCLFNFNFRYPPYNTSGKRLIKKLLAWWVR